MQQQSKYQANYQDLLKTIAIIAMFIDHLGLYFFPKYEVMRVIGRIAMPLFCFFAGYNFHGKPNFKILLWGTGLYILTTILFKQLLTTNILIPIFIGQCYLYYFQDSIKSFFYSGYCHVIALGVLWCITWGFVDYGTLVLAIMTLGYIAQRDFSNLRLALLISVILSLFHTITTFGFSDIYVIMTISLGVIEYILMIMKDFNQQISVNLRIISRYSIYIYCIHLAIIQFMFVYYT